MWLQLIPDSDPVKMGPISASLSKSLCPCFSLIRSLIYFFDSTWACLDLPPTISTARALYYARKSTASIEKQYYGRTIPSTENEGRKMPLCFDLGYQIFSLIIPRNHW